MISAFLLGSKPGYAGPKYIPVVNGFFSTGQWYFDGERSSLGGNVNLTFVPALRYSNRFSLVPIIETKYRGTRSAEELAGGNTLFQDTWETGATIKAVHNLGRKWKLRERVGARTKLFRETTNESLGKGLYDYRIYTVGSEIERKWGKRTSVALGYDFSFLMFPNYDSLESNQSDDLAREFAGDDALDTYIHLVALRSTFPLYWKMSGSFQGYYSPRNYRDQTVVDLSGLLSPEKRLDRFTGTSFALERFFKMSSKMHFLTNISYGYAAHDSNQNHYDARLTTFVPDFYDYDQQKVGGQLSFAYGLNQLGPIVFDTGVSYSIRNYRHRVTQNSNGAYLNSKLWQEDITTTVGFSYPLTKFFRLRTVATFGHSRSNTNYEEVYRYNYNNANYQFGFTYEY